MPVPSRAEAAAIVLSLRPNDRLLRHSTAVAEVASFICVAMTRRAVEIDAMLVESAALLHDLDKMLEDKDDLRKLGHGAAGAEWLRRHGRPELAPAVASHPVLRIGRAASYEAWLSEAGFAGQIVAYADKRARQEIVTLDDRFAHWHQRYPDSRPLDVAHERARRLEHEICELAGVDPSAIGRLEWVKEALDGAH